MPIRKVSSADEEYILAHRRDMSVRQIAEAIGCSKSTVHRVSERLGTRREPVETPVPAAPAVSVADLPDELVLLREHAGRLRREMGKSSGATLAKLSVEYRKTLERITELSDAPEEEAIETKTEECTIDAVCTGIAGTGKAP